MYTNRNKNNIILKYLNNNPQPLLNILYYYIKISKKLLKLKLIFIYLNLIK